MRADDPDGLAAAIAWPAGMAYGPDAPMQSSLIALLVAVVVVFAGNLVGKVLPLLRRFALPGAVLGGLLALLGGPQVLDAAGRLFAPLVPPEAATAVYEGFAELPALFINVVFACLMLGRRFDPLGTVWRRARPLIVMGHVFAWGQYVVGLTMIVTLLHPVLGVDPLAGTLIAIGFQGGHGTAAGLSENFAALGFAEGEQLGLALATVGVLVGVVGGPFLAHVLKRRLERDASDLDERAAELDAAEHDDDESEIPQVLRPNPLTGRLTVHLGLVAIVIGLGWAALTGMQALERGLRPGADMHITAFLPLFSVVLLAGMGLQWLLTARGWDALFDRALFERVSGFALDMVIFGALATLSLEVVGEHWLALALLGLGGVAWNLVVLLLVGPRVYRSPWPAYGLGDFGGGTATTACGLMLVDVVDPERRTDARAAYADKQPFYEPIMGGGLVTAMALPAVATLGPLVALAIAASVLTGWALLAWRLRRPS